jgi:6,7-dimethyl-8-ribityllumazine synthase
MSTANQTPVAELYKNLPNAESLRFGIVVAEWNASITDSLLNGCKQALTSAGVKENHITLLHVPGSFELTAGASYIYQKYTPDAIICLGCVIQGETRHFDFICNAVANGITQLTVMHNRPFIFGVLTTDNLQQAIDRSGGKYGNKGEEAAITAIKMAALLK